MFLALNLLYRIITIGGSIAMTGILAASYTKNLWLFIAFYGILNGIGCGLCVRILFLNFLIIIIVYDTISL